jgi:hypothetical protein
MRETRTHDYTVRGKGWDYRISTVREGGKTLEAQGWGEGIHDGDLLVLPNGDRSTRYEVVSIRYYPDPPDMWSAVLRFTPR